MRWQAVEDHLEHPEDRRAERLAEVGHLGIVAIGRHQVLDQVIGPDRDEVGLAEDRVDADRGGGNFDHDPGLDVLAEGTPSRRRLSRVSLTSLLIMQQLFQGRDHGEEHRDLAVPARAEDRPDLGDQQLRSSRRRSGSTASP